MIAIASIANALQRESVILVLGAVDSADWELVTVVDLALDGHGHVNVGGGGEIRQLLAVQYSPGSDKIRMMCWLLSRGFADPKEQGILIDPQSIAY